MNMLLVPNTNHNIYMPILEILASNSTYFMLPNTNHNIQIFGILDVEKHPNTKTGNKETHFPEES